jgi:hypothetical protein
LYDALGADYRDRYRFNGNLEILLSNGEKIICLDRNINGNQVNKNNIKSIFAVYYLTENEYLTLSNTKISSVTFKFGDQVSGYKNFVF